MDKHSESTGEAQDFISYLSVQYNQGKPLESVHKNKNGTGAKNRKLFVLNDGRKIYLIPSEKPTSAASWQQINFLNTQHMLNDNDMFFYVCEQSSTWFGFTKLEFDYATYQWRWNEETPTTRLFLQKCKKDARFKLFNNLRGSQQQCLYINSIHFERRIFGDKDQPHYIMR